MDSCPNLKLGFTEGYEVSKSRRDDTHSTLLLYQTSNSNHIVTGMTFISIIPTGMAHISVVATSNSKFHSNLFQPSNRHRYRN